jgi:hypothetical protein
MATKATLEIPQSTGRDGAIDHVAKFQDSGSRTGPGRLLHSGVKGDWYLVREPTGICVVHIPDMSTGASPRRMEVPDVLVSGGPERTELLRLIGGLIDD